MTLEIEVCCFSLVRKVFSEYQEWSVLEQPWHFATPGIQLAQLKDSSSTASSSTSPLHCGSSSYASVTKRPPPSSTSVQSTSPMASSPDYDRKFNLILQGIDECPPGTDLKTRLSQDVEKVSRALSSLVSSIDSTSIRDLLRLGKYDSSHTRPRPLLIKMVRATDVSAVLQNKSSLPRSIFIRPDLSKEARSRHKTLMSERKHLIDSGTVRTDIQIRQGSIYVRNLLHGSLDPTDNSKFLRSTASSLALPATSHSSPLPPSSPVSA